MTIGLIICPCFLHKKNPPSYSVKIRLNITNILNKLFNFCNFLLDNNFYPYVLTWDKVILFKVCRILCFSCSALLFYWIFPSFLIFWFIDDWFYSWIRRLSPLKDLIKYGWGERFRAADLFLTCHSTYFKSYCILL